jgi:phosphatidylglycerol lysyltransferase
VHAGDGRIEGWTLDVMRRRTHGFRPVVEFLIASSCLAFRDDGARFVSLSGAPLARAPEAAPTAPLERLLDSFGGVMEPYYGFRSLHAFKTKFKPRYVPMYLAYREEADLPRIGVALARAYLPDASLSSLVRMGKN